MVAMHRCRYACSTPRHTQWRRTTLYAYHQVSIQLERERKQKENRTTTESRPHALHGLTTNMHFVTWSCQSFLTRSLLCCLCAVCVNEWKEASGKEEEERESDGINNTRRIAVEKKTTFQQQASKQAVRSWKKFKRKQLLYIIITIFDRFAHKIILLQRTTCF